MEGYHRTIRILVVPRGCSWYDEYPGTMVRKQVNHGILSLSSDEESVLSCDDEGWYDDEYWYGDIPSCSGTMNSIGGIRNSGGVTRILVCDDSSSRGMINYLVVR